MKALKLYGVEDLRKEYNKMLNQYTEHQPTTSNIIILLYSLGLER
ncbi:hypothetical protein WEU57_09805 [Staphylococcus aureus]